MVVLPTLRTCCALGAMILIAGCQDGAKPPGSVTGSSTESGTEWTGSSGDQSQGRLPSTAGLRKTMFLLVDAIEARDIGRYSRLFDADQFRFFFDPQDTEEYGLPTEWAWPEERSAAQNMFTDESVQSISLELVVGDVEETEPWDEVPLHWHKIQVWNVDLEVTVDDSESEEEVVYKVAGGRATFFLESPPERSFSRRTPRIMQWRDHRLGKFQPTTFLTWGRVKGLYQ